MTAGSTGPRSVASPFRRAPRDLFVRCLSAGGCLAGVPRPQSSGATPL